MTAASPPQTLPVPSCLTLAARALAPVLNRVVLVGAPVVDLLINDPAVRVPRLSFAADAVLQLLSTSMLDRLAPELQKAGCTRIGHSTNMDRWLAGSGVSFDVIQVQPEDVDATQIWFEYATLITLPLAVTGELTLRISGAAAMLALECSSFVRNRERVAESAELERAILLIAGRTEIEKECAAAPPELRAFVASTLAHVARSDALHLLIQRVIPDAAVLPALARRVRERIERIAA